MTESGDQPYYLSRMDALRIVRKFAADPANIVYPEHAMTRMAQRRIS
jgi:hypothetical protein